jgi:hypothetical protein
MVAKTTLAEALDTSETGVDVRDALGFASASETDDLIAVDSEFMLVTAGMGTTTWTVTRGYAGSTAAAHSDGATVTRVLRGWTDLTKVRSRLGLAADDTSSDDELQDIIAAVNDWLTDYIGVFLGPSTDTTRTFDVTGYGRELRIPGGIRTLTAMTVAAGTGGTATTVPVGDALLRPLSLNADEAYDRVILTDDPTGTVTRFSPGYGVVTITGTFGPATVPPRFVEIATRLAVLRWQARNSGASIGSDELGMTPVFLSLAPIDQATVENARLSIATFSYV